MNTIETAKKLIDEGSGFANEFLPDTKVIPVSSAEYIVKGAIREAEQRGMDEAWRWKATK